MRPLCANILEVVTNGLEIKFDPQLNPQQLSSPSALWTAFSNCRYWVLVVLYVVVCWLVIGLVCQWCGSGCGDVSLL